MKIAEDQKAGSDRGRQACPSMSPTAPLSITQHLQQFDSWCQPGLSGWLSLGMVVLLFGYF